MNIPGRYAKALRQELHAQAVFSDFEEPIEPITDHDEDPAV
jgi:hypothetical protein